MQQTATTALLQTLCAAIVLAGTVGPVSAADAPAVGIPHGSPTPAARRTVSALSAEERLHLPDATTVDFEGRTVSLGTLRAEHERRMGRFAYRGPRSIVSVIGSVATSAPTAAHSVQLQVPASYFAQFASDYQAACGPTGWIGPALPCLYLPPNAYLFVDRSRRTALDLDPYVTDAKICQSGGGTLQSAGYCSYRYPLVQQVMFSPPLLAALANGNTTYFSHVIDQHGAVYQQVTTLPASLTWFTTPSDPNVWSTISARIPPASAPGVQVK